MGWIHRAAVCCRDVAGRYPAAACIWRLHGWLPERSGDRLWQHLAHCAGFDYCVLGRQFGECLCHGQDEDHDRRPPSVDANHRLDRRGGTDRLQHFLYDCVLWHLVNRASDRCRDRAVFSENWLGSRHDPGDLPGSRLAEEKRRRGLLRRWH